MSALPLMGGMDSIICEGGNPRQWQIDFLLKLFWGRGLPAPFPRFIRHHTGGALQSSKGGRREFLFPGNLKELFLHKRNRLELEFNQFELERSCHPMIGQGDRQKPEI